MVANWRREAIHKPSIFTFLRIYITDHFPGFKVTHNGKTLFIEGELKDRDWKNSYTFLLCTTLLNPPEVYILNPKITPRLGIHLYPDRSLCLYHPKDLPYDYNFKIVTDIIPWLSKWVHFYEIWLRNGNIWIGPEAPHGWLR
jgi:hypothetical protein